MTSDGKHSIDEADICNSKRQPLRFHVLIIDRLGIESRISTSQLWDYKFHIYIERRDIWLARELIMGREPKQFFDVWYT